MSADEYLNDDQFSAHVELPMGMARRAIMTDHDPGAAVQSLPGSGLLQRARVYRLQRSIREEGIRDPLHFSRTDNDEELFLNDGHHRMEAAQREGLKSVPAVIHYPDETGHYPSNPLSQVMLAEAQRRRPK